ncbi:AAA family ATPase [Methanobrevibacter sp.]|uniref:AAA family ATPase n=1 Tax=Methanobrevibacter sp. TaxID=66852 RepID=UPI00386C18A0
MKFFLLRMKVNGIKSIDKEVQLDFYKGTLSKKFDTANSHVKAIYGPNGAGKTALVYAVEIYKNLVMNSDYLAMSNATGALDNLINQKSKRFIIEMYFAVLNKEQQLDSVYSHKIVLEKVSERYLITEERLCKLTGLQLNNQDKYTSIFWAKNGEILDLPKEGESEKIKIAAMNLLDKQSFVTILIKHIFGDKGIILGNKLDVAVLYSLIFAFSITILMQDSDKNYINFSSVTSQLDAIQIQKKKLNDDNIFLNLLRENRIPQRQTEQVPKKDFEKFEKYIDNLCSFIRVFKDDFQTIEIKKDENGDNYECEIILIYNDGKRINKKYESTGIKKIIEMYSALCSVENGDIVFIDEFDANIHDVLLVKLVEYVMDYAEGQLIFTTHNLAPMDVLQKAKHSIDFLSPDSRITSWTSNGNYTAASLYRKGLIEYSPFNIEPFSFIGVFGDKK